MSSFFLFLHQTRVLAVDEFWALLRRRRSLLSLLIYVGVTLLLIWGLARAEQMVGQMLGDPSVRGEQIRRMVDALAKVAGQERANLLAKLLEQPSALWLFQMMVVFWLPSLVALVSSDMITVDVHRGTLRFLMLRSGRAAYYLGKFLAHFMLYALLQLVSMGVLLGLCSLYQRGFDLGRYGSSAALYFLMSLPYLACLVATASWVSSWSRRPMNALLWVHLIWIVFVVVLIFWPWASPFSFQYVAGLVAPFEGLRSQSVVGFLSWGLGFYLLGLVGFWRRQI